VAAVIESSPTLPGPPAPSDPTLIMLFERFIIRVMLYGLHAKEVEIPFLGIYIGRKNSPPATYSLQYVKLNGAWALLKKLPFNVRSATFLSPGETSAMRHFGENDIK